LRSERQIVGDRSPLFYYIFLVIDKKNILQILNSSELEIDFFIVDVEVNSGNRIRVYVDNTNGITIGNCAKISRFIEHRLLETDVELNFELNVSSPGMDIPFKVKQQYDKSIGKEVEVIDQDNRKIKGILLRANEESIDIEEKKSVKVPGRKKKELILEVLTIPLKNIKSTKLIISFK